MMTERFSSHKRFENQENVDDKGGIKDVESGNVQE